MSDDGENVSHLAHSMTVEEFAELQSVLIIGLACGLEGAKLNRAMATACGFVIAPRASTSPRPPRPRPHLRVIKEDDPLGAA